MRPNRPLETKQRSSGRFVLITLMCVLLLIVAGVVALVYVVSSAGKQIHIEMTEGNDWDREDEYSGRVTRSFFEATDDGSERIEADITVAAGRIQTALAEQGTLFQAEVSLTTDGLRPLFNHDQNNRVAQVSLDLEGNDASFSSFNETRANTWQLYFSPDKPLDLGLALGAAEAMLDLTGIPLEELKLDCGMAATTVRFDEPNPTVLRRMEIQSGLSAFRAEGLGNARFQTFEFDAGAGDFTLDFSGDAFQAGAEADVSVGMASLDVLLPQSHPIHITANKTFMTSLEMPNTFVQIERDFWVSPGSEGNEDALKIKIESGPGSVNVRMVE